MPTSCQILKKTKTDYVFFLNNNFLNGGSKYVVLWRTKNFERSNFGISKNVIVSCPLLLL
jgi:hypothetical protein